MKAMEQISTYLKDRPAQLEAARKNGVKIIGYFPGNYVPEEIIYAAGAVPICLIHGGIAKASDAASSVIPPYLCPFALAQIGERLLKENPYYGMLDMLVAPMTCIHLKKLTDLWEYYTDVKVFRLGIPHQHHGGFETEYFIERLKALRNVLQTFTGNEITNEKIGEAINLYNRMRGLLKKISLMRKLSRPPISGSEFIKLNHASFYADPTFMVETLDSIYQELEQQKQVSEPGMPRLLLLGPNIGYGDYKVLNLIEESGGEIVIEEICEGVRYYWQDIENSGDLFQSLAKGYLVDKLPCAYMLSSAKKRLDFTLKLIKDFNVNGVIWYELLSCETYDSESYYFAEKLGERNIPMLILESDYGTADRGQIKTRIEAFIEIVKGGNV
jgi:benzoyl-CoA reductase/2-hydroxyglutaryl-CoA dehydratase subunit BcrC/BadD/HgdB